MKFSASQQKALKAAGYSVSKSGDTVLNSSGGSVAGYNENGKFWGGSAKVKAALAAKEAPAAPKKAAPKAKPAAKAKPVVKAKPAAPRPKAKPEQKPKVASNPPTRPVSPTPSKPKPDAQRKDPMSKARLAEVTKDEYKAMSRGERRAKGLPVGPIDYIQAGGNTSVKGGSGTKLEGKEKPWWEKGIKDLFNKKDKK